jgi:hypothetical protein
MSNTSLSVPAAAAGDSPKPASQRGLNRKEACDFLDMEYGLKRTPRTLAKEAVLGIGPRFYHVGRAVRMLTDDLRAYAEAKIGPRVASTSELTALRAASAPAHVSP